MPPRIKMDRDPLGGLADMFGQMPGDVNVIKFISSVEKCYQGTIFWTTKPREPFSSEVSSLLKGPNL